MAERRRSQRITLQITIQLVGMQAGGSSAVAQPALTLEVNDQGGLIQTRTRFEPGNEVMIHNPKNLQNGLFRIVWSKPSRLGSSWNTAVEFQEPNAEDFWGCR